jgi:hypothetical protein
VSSPTILPGVRPDALTLYSFRLEKSSGFSIPRAVQLAPASLPATIAVKSAAYSMGRWRFTESLAIFYGRLTMVANKPILPMRKLSLLTLSGLLN